MPISQPHSLPINNNNMENINNPKLTKPQFFIFKAYTMKPILSTLIFFLIISVAYAQDYSPPPTEVTEVDSTPSTFPYQVQFPDNTVTEVSGGVVQVDVGGVDGSGTADFITRWSATDTLADAPVVVVTALTDEGINAAIDALGAEGGIVLIPEGTYVIDGVITIDVANTILQGCGQSTVLDASAWVQTDDIIACSFASCAVKDLKIKGQKGGGSAFHLIDFNGSYARLENLYLEDADTDAIHLTGGSYFTISDCVIDDPDQYGIYTQNTANDGLIIGCYLTSCDSYGMQIGGNKVTIVGCQVLAMPTGSRGIWVASNCKIIGCHITGTGTAKLVYLRYGGNQVSDCYMYLTGTGGYVIEMPAAGSGYISSNYIWGGSVGADTVIYCAGDNSIIANNNIYGTSLTGNGIEFPSGADNNQVLYNLWGLHASATKVSDSGANNMVVDTHDTSGELVVNADQKLIDSTPHLEFEDSDTGDKDFELYADDNQFYLTDLDNSKVIMRVNSESDLILEESRVTKYAWIPAGAVRVAGGSGATETTNGSGYIIISFPDNLDRYIQANIKIPDDMDLSRDSYICMGWSSPTQSANGIVDMDYLITAENDATDIAGTSDDGNSITSSATADGLVVSPIVTLSGGTIAGDEVCLHIQVMRDGNNAADTLDDVLELHGMAFKYTANKLGEIQ